MVSGLGRIDYTSSIRLPDGFWNKVCFLRLNQVALRSGATTMKKQADHLIMNEVDNWEWDDFKPIAEAIDEIFRQKGWLST